VQLVVNHPEISGMVMSSCVQQLTGSCDHQDPIGSGSSDRRPWSSYCHQMSLAEV